jgi:hypothetical protein
MLILRSRLESSIIAQKASAARSRQQLLQANGGGDS